MERPGIKAFEKSEFDIFVVGGGIYGAWTALNAASKGLKVGLVEQGDWAGQTSSASSKLIHGGLRYLEQFDFSLVKKNLAERHLLMKLAPHQVKPLNFRIIDHRKNRVSGWKFRLGLKLYDFFAGKLDRSLHSKSFSKRETVSSFRFLKSKDLKGSFRYMDCQEDDARLVLELIETFITMGGVAGNYLKANIDLSRSNKKINRIEVKDLVSKKVFQVRAKTFVFATGSEIVGSGDKVRYTKGVHLVLPKLATSEALLLLSPIDQRVFFVIPWNGLTLLGTTDTNFKRFNEKLSVDEKDISYLLSSLNYFLKNKFKREDVISSFCGIRTLLDSPKKSASDLKRDWSFKSLSSNTYQSIGGKYTSARADADVLVNYLCTHHFQKKILVEEKLRLNWNPNDDNFYVDCENKLVDKGVLRENAQDIIQRHGIKALKISESIGFDSRLKEPISKNTKVTKAELSFICKEEMVVHLEDLLRRRTPILLIQKVSRKDLDIIAKFVGKILNWGEPRILQEKKSIANLYKITD